MVPAYGQMVMTQTPSLGVAVSDTIVKIPDFNVLNVYILSTYYLLDEAYGQIGKGTRLYTLLWGLQVRILLCFILFS